MQNRFTDLMEQSAERELPMSQEIEIEFKNLLTKAQYEQLLEVFSISASQIHRQVNHYFDTPDQHLKKLSSACLKVDAPTNR